MSFDWKATLGAIAPTLATAIGGPLGGVAVKIASDALGINPDQDEIERALASGDPQVLAQLKKAEHDFKVEMKSLGVELEKVHAGDRGSARSLAKQKGFTPQALISVVFVSGFVGILYLLFFSPVEFNAGQRELASILLGILAAGLNQIMNFWFGSSSGSKEKTEAMARLNR